MTFKEVLLEELDAVFDEDTPETVRILARDVVELSTEIFAAKLEGLDVGVSEEALKSAAQSLKTTAHSLVAERVRRLIVGGYSTMVKLVVAAL